MAHGHVEMELKMSKIMVAHGHVEMEVKLLVNYGGTWTCKEMLKNDGGTWTCRGGGENVEKLWWHLDM